MEFLTLEEFKDIQNIKSPAQDAEHSLTINAVNAFIQSYLGYSDGGVTTRTVYFNGNQEVLDDNWASITSVTGGTSSLGFTLSRGYVLTLSEDYTGDVLISGTLATNTVSPALKQAAMSLVLYYIKNQYLKSISNGVDSVSLADYASVPVHIKSILDLYRLV